MAQVRESDTDTGEPMRRGVRGFSPAALRAARQRAGWDYGTLADASGVSASSIGGWERGTNEPSPRRLKLVADALGIAIADLVRPSTSRTLTAIRTALGLSVDAAAAAAGISRATLSRTESGSGEVTPRTIHALALAYALDEHDIEQAWRLTRNQRLQRIRAETAK
jgi:transcriptional regulator with XRE-family HTH domain